MIRIQNNTNHFFNIMRILLVLVSVYLICSCTPEVQNEASQLKHRLSCSSQTGIVNKSLKSVLTKRSTAKSNIQLLTGRYENNLKKIVSWLPERWQLISVVKWSAYGNGINILGPTAAKTSSSLGVISNQDAEALATFNPDTIMRIGPTNYETVKDAIDKNLKVQEFIGKQSELEAVKRVAQENNQTIDASIYLYDHYGDPWGFEFDSSKELQQLVDSIEPRLIRVRGIFSHLVRYEKDTDASLNQQISKFLKVACPVAVGLASTLKPEDAPFLVHWGASSELSRLRNPNTGKLEIPEKLKQAAQICLSHPKINFGIRVGSAAYNPDTELPGLRTILHWTSEVSKLNQTPQGLIAEVNVGIKDGYPRIFQQENDWGVVSIEGQLYPLVSAPEKNRIKINLGLQPNDSIRVGTEVCLICDDLTVDDLYQWVAIDSYNIAMCATGACSEFAEATSFDYEQAHPVCNGPVVVYNSKNN